MPPQISEQLQCTHIAVTQTLSSQQGQPQLPQLSEPLAPCCVQLWEAQ